MNERGAMLVQVALSIVTLLCFAVFVVDYGIVWVARGQAQNAADAGALAGAVARAFDDRAHPPATTIPGSAATGAAEGNAVWGEPPVVGEPVFSWGDEPCPPGIGGRCARVDVFRNAESGNALPVVFGSLLGITEQGVRATATARAGIATTTRCLKPWAVADRWIELRDGDTARPGPAPWTMNDFFDRWTIQGNNYTPYANPVDTYVPPSPTSTGSGFTPADNIGLQLVLQPGSDTGNNTEFPSGWWIKLDLDCTTGNCNYRDSIVGCTSVNYSIGDELAVSTHQGNKIGQTVHAINGQGQQEGLLDTDPGARWLNGQVVDSDFPVSPRIVPIALFDISEYLSNGPTGKSTVRIVNLIGFFVQGICRDLPDGSLEPYALDICRNNGPTTRNGGIVGRIMPLPGLLLSTNPAPIGEESSFLSVIQLVR